MAIANGSLQTAVEQGKVIDLNDLAQYTATTPCSKHVVREIVQYNSGMYEQTPE